MVVPRWKIGFEVNAVRRCEQCGADMPQLAWSLARYKTKRFCDAKCRDAWENNDKNTIPWYDSPPREHLNKLWSKHRSYAAMAVMLGVTTKKIEDWLGPERYMQNPGLVQEPVTRPRGWRKKKHA